MEIAPAVEGDLDAFRELAAEVEDLFGPMVDDPGFQDAVNRNIQRGSALLVRNDLGGLAAGLLFSYHHHPIYTVRWLVVAENQRANGIGRTLLAEAFRRWVSPPAVVEVVTFGPDHPGARSRSFYEQLGFRAEEPAGAGPEGGSRQVFRLRIDALPLWASAPPE